MEPNGKLATRELFYQNRDLLTYILLVAIFRLIGFATFDSTDILMLIVELLLDAL
jgi:hypothetical protein